MRFAAWLGFLFWDLNAHRVLSRVVELGWQEKADVLILAERDIDSGTLLYAAMRAPSFEKRE